MISEEHVLRLLTIQGNQALWSRLCRKVNREIALAHPNYPPMRDTQVLSYVKRLLPEIRAMVAAIERSSSEPDKT